MVRSQDNGRRRLQRGPCSAASSCCRRLRSHFCYPPSSLLPPPVVGEAPTSPWAGGGTSSTSRRSYQVAPADSHVGGRRQGGLKRAPPRGYALSLSPRCQSARPCPPAACSSSHQTPVTVTVPHKLLVCSVLFLLCHP